MSRQWHYSKQNQCFGPISDEQLQSLAQSGQLHPTDLIWTKGMANWMPAQSIGGLTFARLVPQAPAFASPVDDSPLGFLDSLQETPVATEGQPDSVSLLSGHTHSSITVPHQKQCETSEGELSVAAGRWDNRSRRWRFLVLCRTCTIPYRRSRGIGRIGIWWDGGRIWFGRGSVLAGYHRVRHRHPYCAEQSPPFSSSAAQSWACSWEASWLPPSCSWHSWAGYLRP